MDDVLQHQVNRLLHNLKTGKPEAFSQLLPVVYDELHRIAARQRRQWDGDETFNTTALVHEAYLRLVDQSSQQWESYPHFLAVASTAMRQILLDYAKRKHAAKRGGGYQRIPLDDIDAALTGSSVDDDSRSAVLIALDESLRRLEQLDQRQSRIVECRFFGGMTIEDTSTALGIAPATVSRGWEVAKAWLYRDLKKTLSELE